MRVYKCPLCKRRLKIVNHWDINDSWILPQHVTNAGAWVCSNVCCLLWRKGYWVDDGGGCSWKQVDKKLINIPDLFPETKEKPKSKLKKMWNSFFCTVGIHDYKKECFLMVLLEN